MDFTAAVTREASLYAAQCLDVDVASQGTSVEDAAANLKEALELYFEDHDLPTEVEPPIITTIPLSA